MSAQRNSGSAASYGGEKSGIRAVSATRRWRDPSEIALWTDPPAIFGGKAAQTGIHAFCGRNGSEG